MKTLILPLLALLAGGQDQVVKKSVGVFPRTGAVTGKPIYTGSFALFVGIGKYANQGITGIPSAPNDAKTIRSILIQKYGFDPNPDHTVLLLDKDATKERIETELARLCDPKRVKPTDRVFVFFSCHGQSLTTRDKESHGYILPYGAEVNFSNINDASGYQTSCIKMDEIVEKLKESDANHRVVVLDACFSGLAVAIGKDVVAKAEFDPETIQNDLDERGLYVLAAGTAKQETFGTSNPNGLSVFTKAFAETLKENAVHGKPAFIEQIAFEAGERTILASKGKQRPTPLDKTGVGSMMFIPAKGTNLIAPSESKVALLSRAGNRVGDTLTNPKDETEFVWVPGGSFRFGHPGVTASLNGFWIAKNDVTWGQYKRFCQETKRRLPKLPPFPITDDHPVVNVTWQDAFDYCEWSGCQLPSEEQWEAAARGSDGRKFPWGDTFDPMRCQTSAGGGKKVGTSPVGTYPSGASVFGCQDMAGNVNQWTSSPWNSKYNYCVSRGGSWRTPFEDGVASFQRLFSILTYADIDLGFRVCGPSITL